MSRESVRLLARQAQNFLNEAVAQLPEGSFQNLTKATLTQSGLYHWEHTYKGVEAGDTADHEATMNYVRWMEELMQEDPIQGYYQLQMTQIPDQKIAILSAARWADAGLPVFRLGHKKIAALMATNISESSLEHVYPPWPAFYIEVPDGLLHVKEGTLMQSIKGILVHVLEHPKGTGDVVEGTCWTWMAVTGTRLVQWNLNAKIENLGGNMATEEDYWSDFWLEFDDYDKRLNMLIGRLIMSLCLTMNDISLFKERKEAYHVPGAKKSKKGTQDAPNYRVFVDAVLAGYCKSIAIKGGKVAIVRGLRAVSDFEQEMAIASLNLKLNPMAPTVFFPTEASKAFVSSSAAKELARFEGTKEALLQYVHPDRKSVV